MEPVIYTFHGKCIHFKAEYSNVLIALFVPIHFYFFYERGFVFLIVSLRFGDQAIVTHVTV